MCEPSVFEKEQALRQKISDYVDSLNGQFREHCSDEFLKQFLFLAYVSGQGPYPAGQYVFEGVLETGCRACHGHHQAQHFCRFMKE